MKIEFTKTSLKQLERLPKNKRRKTRQVLSNLVANPYAGKKLSGGYQNSYSLRVWPYRIIYKIRKKEKSIIITGIQHRQGAYK